MWKKNVRIKTYSHITRLRGATLGGSMTGRREDRLTHRDARRKAVSGWCTLTAILVLSFVLFMATVATAAYTWTGTGGPDDGAVSCMTMDQTHNILYAGTTNGQVYRCQSGAWSSTGGPATGHMVNDIKYDPISNTLVASVYTGEFQVWTFQQGGTWTLTNGAVGNYNPFAVVSDGQQKKLYAITTDGQVWIYDYESAPGPWASIGTPLDDGRCLVLDTTRHVLYAAGNVRPGGNLVAAVSKYDGSDWSSFSSPGVFGTNGLSVSSMVLDSTRNILYAGIYTNTTGELNVFRRDIGTGGNWVGIGALCGGPDIYALALDETNNTLYASPYDGHVYKNCDASVGSTWIDTGRVSSASFYNRCLAYDAGSATLYAGSWDAIVYRQGVPALTAIDPPSGAQGQTMDVEITAKNSSFTTESEAVFSGDGVIVNSTTRLS
jgi:hypothetical protein